jgi:ParB-like chromosome segregation protein Spo0J
MSDIQLEQDVELVERDTLIPYTNNPKEHPDEQVKKIASSIKNYGWDQPIVVDENNEIIKGHGRVQAAELLDLAHVPVIQREDLTDAEKKASRIADNKTAESAWEDEALGVEVDVLEGSEEIELESLGFDDNELDSLIEEATLDDEDISEAFGEIPDGERDEIRQKTFTLSETQVETVENALETSKDMGEFPPSPNDNSNGNALARVCTKFLETH